MKDTPRDEKISSVRRDDYEEGHQAARYLIGLGHEALVTIEEGSVGGFGSHVAQLLAEEGAFDEGLKFRSMVLPDWFIDQGSPAEMYEEAGLQAADIEARALEALGIAQIAGKRA